MTLSESFLVALFSLTVVFTVLACLYGFLKLFSFAVHTFTPAHKTAGGVSSDNTPIKKESAPEMNGQLILKEVDEKTAAMIMAIVSHESGIDLSELRFKSIQLIKR